MLYHMAFFSSRFFFLMDSVVFCYELMTFEEPGVARKAMAVSISLYLFHFFLPTISSLAVDPIFSQTRFYGAMSLPHGAANVFTWRKRLGLEDHWRLCFISRLRESGNVDLTGGA
jgi:hypothetical protein